MKLTLAEPKYLKDSIAIISDLVNEATFKVTKDSIEMVAMDPANVAMVIFKLLSSSFQEFQVEKEQEIAINLNSFKQVLRRANTNDVLTLEVEEEKLKVTLKANSTRTFSLPIIDIQEREQKVPELNFGVVVETTSDVLNQAIEDASVVAESVSFLLDDGTFTILSKGDLSKAKVDITEDEDTKISVEGETPIKAKYSIEYLKKMIAGSKLSDNVSIRFSKDYPLRLDYINVDKVSLSFILAPRVENE